jgi:hypothetical protein
MKNSKKYMSISTPKPQIAPLKNSDLRADFFLESLALVRKKARRFLLKKIIS